MVNMALGRIIHVNQRIISLYQDEWKKRIKSTVSFEIKNKNRSLMRPLH